jgi:peptidyl-prolyl cis-trans isomerase C
MKKKFVPLILISPLLILGCEPESTTPAATDVPAVTAPTPVAEPVAAVAKEDAVAIVNGVAISKATFKTLEDEIAVRAQGQKFPKKQLLDELIQRELLVQDAQKKHLEQSAEVKERLKMAENSLLTQVDLQDYLKANPIADTDLKAAYDKEVAKMSGVEYKARHILVKTEDEAKKIIAELAKGAKFEDLAKAQSTDSSKDQGGDLGWFTEGQMVEPFSKAVASLEKGKYTQTPIQTQFGWHVILREDSRTQTPPPFDSVKEQLRPALQQQKVQALLENLRKQAKVEILMSLEEPKPATPAAADKPASATATPEASTTEAAKPADASAPSAATPSEPAPAAEATTPEATPVAAEAAKTEAASTPAPAVEAPVVEAPAPTAAPVK